MSTRKTRRQLLSMTGFGRAKAEGDGFELSCEIRSVNYRGLDVKMRLPRSLYAHENEYQKMIHTHFSRGRVDVFVEIAMRHGEGVQAKFNAKAAAEVLSQLSAFQKKHEAVKPELSMGDLLGLRELFVISEGELEAKHLHTMTKKILASAIDDAVGARREEGTSLLKIVDASLDEAERLVKEITKRLANATHAHYNELRKRIETLVESSELDEMRMAQEVAYIAERADVAEEVERLGAHISHFRTLCDIGGAAGRKLDFLCQEMFREANTASSKIADTKTTYLVVDLKSEIERIREQVQNIE